MLCDRCGQKEAKVFLTQIVEQEMKKASLCETCGEPFVIAAKNPEELEAALKRSGYPIPELKDVFEKVAAGSAYDQRAYEFVREGVQRALAIHAAEHKPGRHVSAAELLDTLRSLALERFGSRARQELALWGVFRCEDFGEIVFSMIDHGLFGKAPEDRKEDFSGGYDFESAFPAASSSSN
jgi:uncharacterized repeat protein (TIGR04138 family)